MNLLRDGPVRFSRLLPVYNWYYPLNNQPARGLQGERRYDVFSRLDPSPASSRGLYFHIPFCETICSFCPFVRGRNWSSDVVERYTRALIREIEFKTRFDAVSRIPVGAIFFGGGTPSVLSPDQIQRIGAAIHERFDLRQLREFSFECEVKSITPEKVEALREIGVTHARFGLQTFNPTYRRFFALTASMEQVERAIELLPKYFPHASFDMLYGMSGQTPDEFVRDVELARATGIRNIDFYPINDLVTQPRLQRAFRADDRAPTSALTKFYMNVLLRELMTDAGYLPHNGHGYVTVPVTEIARRPVVTDRYTFWYHEYVYGYSDAELIGFGTNAISSLNGFVLTNDPVRDRYVASLLRDDGWRFTVGEHSAGADASKPVITRLPYHGTLEKRRVNWDLVHPDTRDALRQLVDAGLVVEKVDSYALTLEGWYWYVNLMYYLSPARERQTLDDFIARQSARVQQGVSNLSSQSQMRKGPAVAFR